MKVGIIGAMEPEVILLQRQLKQSAEHNLNGIKFSTGILNEIDVIILQSGIGKVSAAIGTTLMIHHFQPKMIINTGSAGGFESDLNIGDIIISKEVVHHDVDVTAFGYAIGQVPQQPAAYLPDQKLIEAAQEAIAKLGNVKAKEGLICTGDSFICTPEKTKEIVKNFPTISACEMEAAAIAQTCHQLKVPFVVIRSLSDNANNDSPVDFDSYIEKAGQHSAEMVMYILEILAQKEKDKKKAPF